MPPAGNRLYVSSHLYRLEECGIGSFDGTHPRVSRLHDVEPLSFGALRLCCSFNELTAQLSEFTFEQTQMLSQGNMSETKVVILR